MTRLFEPAIHRRLAPGEIGVLIARAGVGKTACLIQFALAELASGRAALHVALDETVTQVRGRYDRLFEEAGRRGLLEATDTNRMELERRRHIHSFKGQGIDGARLGGALAFLQDVMEFRPEIVVVDHYRFDQVEPDAVAGLGGVASEFGIPLWLTALAHRHAGVDQATGLPEPLPAFVGHLQVVLQLMPEDQHVRLRVLRDHDDQVARTLPLHLDPASQLLVSA